MNILDNPAFKDPQVQLQFFMLMLESLIALWVVNDARTRGKTAGAAYLWGLGTLLLFPIVLPVWFFTRPKTDSSSTSNTPTSNTQTSSTRSTPHSPFGAPETRTPIPENGDAARSKICDSCGKFYLGKYDKCPHCGAPISN